MFCAVFDKVDKIYQMPVEPVKKTDVEEEEEDDEEYEGEDTGEDEADEEDKDERRNRIETEKILGGHCLKKVLHTGNTESFDVLG